MYIYTYMFIPQLGPHKYYPHRNIDMYNLLSYFHQTPRGCNRSG